MATFKYQAEFDGVKIGRETPLAVEVFLAEQTTPIWIPKTQISDDSEVWKEGDSGTLIISEWIAAQKGII
jgi:hypothetical protein